MIYARETKLGFRFYYTTAVNPLFSSPRLPAQAIDFTANLVIITNSFVFILSYKEFSAMKKEKNQSRQSQYYQTAGIFYVILALNQFTSLLNYQSVGAVLLTLGYILIAIPLVTKKKNMLPVIGFGVLALSAVYSVITYQNAINTCLNVINLAASLLMCWILMAWVGNKSAATKKTTKKLCLIPAILTVLCGVVTPIFYGYPSSAIISSLLWTVIRALAMYYAAAGIMHLEDAPAAASAPAVEVEPEDTASEELKAYKSLLENGIISQEEYDAKREELGL